MHTCNKLTVPKCSVSNWTEPFCLVAFAVSLRESDNKVTCYFFGASVFVSLWSFCGFQRYLTANIQRPVHQSIHLLKERKSSYIDSVAGHQLTGVEDASEHPALRKTDGHSSVGVLQQDLDAAGPSCRRRAHRVVFAPVSHQHTVVILSVNLRPEWDQRSATQRKGNVWTGKFTPEKPEHRVNPELPFTEEKHKWSN